MNEPKTTGPRILTRCRRCRREAEFPHPSSPEKSTMNWIELVLTRKEDDAEYARMLYETQPKRVVAEFFACTCGGPLEVLEK